MKIGFVGAGKVGKALGLYFQQHGLNITGYNSKTPESAQTAAKLTESQVFLTLESLIASSDIIFISVPDQIISEIDQQVADIMIRHPSRQSKVWIHVSGAHASGCLSKLKKLGQEVGSMHPLQSFGDPISSAANLEQTWFTLEGTKQAVDSIKGILDQKDGKYSLIDEENKPLYHAGACVISNFLVTLLESGIRFFESAGMEREHIFQAITPLIDATLSNVKEKGTIDALTGPIVRGDYNTIDVHLKAIQTHLPTEFDFYRSMALKTVQMLKNNRLSDEQIKKIQCILKEKN